MMEALVGEQVGFTQRLLNVSPSFLILSKLGVFGLILPSEKPEVASFHMSSAMIKRIFGLSEVLILGWSSSLLQLTNKAINRHSEKYLIRLKLI